MENETLDQWADRCAPFLRQNLAVNIDTYCLDLTEDDKEQFLRMNLIMIRQWASPNNGEPK